MMDTAIISTPVTATFCVVPPMTIRAPMRVNPPQIIDDIYLIASKLPYRTAISRLLHMACRENAIGVRWLGLLGCS